jgi:PEP-CTERM motif
MDGSGGQRLTDLDLELFQVNNLGQKLGGPIDFSTSDIDNVEHIYFPGLAAGKYDLEVLNRMANQSDVYALAWSVPEPATFVLLMLGAPLVYLARRCRMAAQRGSKINGFHN